MMMRNVLVLCSLVLLSGCFSAPPKYWQHKSIAPEQWGDDHRRCKRAADKYLERTPRYFADQGLSDYEAQMRLYDAGKKRDKLVADCMRKLGYVPAR